MATHAFESKPLVALSLHAGNLHRALDEGGVGRDVAALLEANVGWRGGGVMRQDPLAWLAATVFYFRALELMRMRSEAAVRAIIDDEDRAAACTSGGGGVLLA
jgi:hypothetical protein